MGALPKSRTILIEFDIYSGKPKNSVGRKPIAVRQGNKKNMTHKLIFSPDLNIDPSDFVSDWNTGETTRDKAIAKIENESMRSFSPMADIAVAQVILPIAVGIATNVLYDLIKSIIQKQQPGMSIKIMPHADGNIIQIAPGAENMTE